MNKLRIAVWLLLTFCFSVSVNAQDQEQLFDGIERVFREKEPQWKIVTQYGKGEVDPLSVNFVFRSGKQQAAVDIVIWRNVKDASDSFKAREIAKNRTSKRTRRHRLPGFGDEGYIRLHPGSDAWPTIDFRKGGLNVSVFAPSTAVAKRFAQHILELINANQH